MNIQPLLDRLSQAKPQRPDAAALRRLYRAWRTQVPYENLDLQIGRTIDIDPATLLDKFGRRRRGGTCYQMNAALALLLESVGFDVSIVEGAVLRELRGDGEWGNHIAFLVHLPGSVWLGDVGIGDSFLDPLPLKEGVHRQGELTYRVERLGEEIWRVHHDPNGTVSSWDIHTRPRRAEEYAARASASQSTLKKVLVAQTNRDGVEYALRSRLVTHGSTRRELESYADFTSTLAENFGVPLDDFTEDELAGLWDRTEGQYKEWLVTQARARRRADQGLDCRVMDVTAQTPAPPVPLEQLWTIAPPVLKRAIPLGQWRTDLLWQLRLPVRQVLVADLDWLLDLPVWQAYGRHFAVSPREVLDDPERFAHQYARSMSADLAFPLHLYEWNGRIVILDGFHRLVKAVIVGRNTLPAMILSGEDYAGICDRSS